MPTPISNMAVEKLVSHLKEILIDDKKDKRATIANLCYLGETRPDLFTSDAITGFRYLYTANYNTVCEKCNDVGAYIWLRAYARAFLDNTPLPQFPTNCWDSMCE